MALGSWWSLLAVAIVAAWISGATAAAASTSSEEAGSSQKSINCMLCSRTYVGDAYLNTLTGQLPLRSGLTEMLDSGDICKGLAEDVEMPKLSELRRHLVGEGSHRRLVYSVKFGACQDTMVNFFDGYDANLVIIEKLPNGVFADPFELHHFVERKVFLDVAVFGDSNLELPSALSNQSAVEIHVDLRPSTSMNSNHVIIDLPLHARYSPLDASGYATVEFGSPDLLLRYRKKEIHSDSCLWALKNLDAAPVEKAAWRIPCGDEAHTGFVSSITFLSALVCSISIVLAALIL
uniref:Phosphatidylinositol-glycan biosynthesis class X protein n=1 Tax=Arundo donax TaxID=35708 RepID=A0A0A9DRE0_ARUDO